MKKLLIPIFMFCTSPLFSFNFETDLKTFLENLKNKEEKQKIYLRGNLQTETSQKFIEDLNNKINLVNLEIEEERKILLNHKQYPYMKISILKNKYNIVNLNNKEEIEKKVHPIEKDLAISQGGIESGNGTSFYAKKYNNIFGIYKRKGEIQKFPTLLACVKEYAKILNSVEYYEKYRELRFFGEKSFSKRAKAVASKYCEDDKKYLNLLNNYKSNFFIKAE